MPRLALYGSPGAGKSTFARMLADALRAKGLPVLTLKIGTPLYELQALIYQVAGAPLLTSDRQDGLLLNDLGAHLRRINPGALTETFTRRVHQCARENPEAVLMCDDMRAPDVDTMTGLNFEFVQIWAPDDLRRSRKQDRGDLTAGCETHITETPPDCRPHHRVDNTGSLDQLRVRAATLIGKVVR